MFRTFQPRHRSVRSTQKPFRPAVEALEDREPVALAPLDKYAFGSEVFEAAVDGIVELDHKDVIVRANGAFCRMIELPQSLVEGQPWSAPLGLAHESSG